MDKQQLAEAMKDSHRGRKVRVTVEQSLAANYGPEYGFLCTAHNAIPVETIVGLEFLSEPLKVGDEIQPETPEPPIGTLLAEKHSPIVFWLHTERGWMGSNGGGPLKWGINERWSTTVFRETVVRYIPDEA